MTETNAQRSMPTLRGGAEVGPSETTGPTAHASDEAAAVARDVAGVVSLCGGWAVRDVRPHWLTPGRTRQRWRGTSRTALRCARPETSGPTAHAPRRAAAVARFAAAAVLVLAAGWAAAQGTVQLPGGLTLTDVTLCPELWAHGVVERRFVVENPTPLTRTVTLEIPGETYSGREGLHALSGTVVVGPGARAALAMPQPPLRVSGADGRVGVQVRGERRIVRPCRSPSFDPYRGYSDKWPPSVLISKGLSAEALKARLVACAPERATAPRRSFHGGPVEAMIAHSFNRQNLEAFKPLRFEGEGAAWPQNWPAYSAFDGCVIAAADFERMPGAARAALRAYAAAGGHVTFMGLQALPEGWAETGHAAAPFDGGAEARLGFGTVRAVGETELSALSSNSLARLSGAWFATGYPWAEVNDNTRGCLTNIPVAEHIRVPVGRFLLILLAFTLIAGPGAVVVTGRTNRRLLLLALVPGFSILFSVAILVYALVSEGVTPSLRRQAVTLLDQPLRQAATLGAMGVYAPTSLRDGLRFENGTEVTPLSSPRAARVVCGRDQHYASGWVTPRMPAFFRLRRSEERSERLLVEERGDGAVEVVNALGAPILRLLLCDRAGQLYEARDLAPGEKRSLTAGAARQAKSPSAYEKMRGLYQTAEPGWGLLYLTTAMPEGAPVAGVPTAGTYVAALDGCPFLEDPLAYCRTRETSRSIVAGKY